MVKASGFGGGFSTAGPGKLGDRWEDECRKRCHRNLEDHLTQTEIVLHLGRFIFFQNDPELTAKAPQQWLRQGECCGVTKSKPRPQFKPENLGWTWEELLTPNSPVNFWDIAWETQKRKKKKEGTQYISPTDVPSWWGTHPSKCYQMQAKMHQQNTGLRNSISMETLLFN